MIYLFLNFLLIIHPIYISSTNVVINDDKLEIKVKLFRDDLEDGLRDFHGFSISIDSPNKIEKKTKKDPKTKKRANKYVGGSPYVFGV